MNLIVKLLLRYLKVKNNMKTNPEQYYCSRQLCQWLQERGCTVESDKIWLYTEMMCVDVGKKSTEDEYSLEDRSGFPKENTVGRDTPAYSWADILIFKAREFWGEGCFEYDYYNDEEGSKFCEVHPQQLLSLLQQNNIKDAELYVREHSVFNTGKK